jgi:Tol biopolymer transport system component
MAWAPGAGRIAVVLEDDQNGFTDVFIYTPRTGRLTRLLLDQAGDRVPNSVDWSHDARRLVFGAWETIDPGTGEAPASDLYTVAPDGGGEQQITNTPDVEDSNPRWSPDDRRLLFGKSEPDPTCGDGFNAFIVNSAADGTDQQRVRGGCHAIHAGWSPDGLRAVVDNRDEGLRTVPIDGSGGKVDLGAGSDPSYRPQP